MTEEITVKFVGSNLREADVRAFHGQEDVFEGILSQLGPSLVDEEASNYASTLLHTAEPIEGDKTIGLRRIDHSTVAKGTSGYFSSDDLDTVRNALEQLGPSLDDEEVSNYMARMLG